MVMKTNQHLPMEPKLPYQLRKNQLWGLMFFGVLLLFLKVGLTFYQPESDVEHPNFKFHTSASEGIILTEFDPNVLDAKQWLNMGFSPKQVATILKYKASLGGQFTSKQQLQKCYAISDEKFSQIKNFILLPESSETKFNYTTKTFDKQLNIPKRFNPNDLSLEQWIAMGFSEKQAASLLRYKEALGGKFANKEQFSKSFVLSNADYTKMQSHIVMPESTPIQKKGITYQYSNPIHYSPFDPNTIDLEGWKNMGYSEAQAQSILNYKNKILQGSFRSLEDVQKSYILKSNFEKLKSYIRLNPENFTEKKNQYTSYNKPQRIIKTDFSTADINTLSYKQLLEFGLDQESAGRLIGFRGKLGGFVSKEQILSTYDVDKVKVQELLDQAKLDTQNVKKYTLLTAPESWLKSHPYFKYSADKIIFYRISFKDEKKIWKKLKLKPKYEERMRWYLQ